MTTLEAGHSNHVSATAPRLPWWLVAIGIVGSVLMIVGAVIALVHPETLLTHDQPVNQGVRIYAGYVVSRNLALGFFLLAALSLRMRGALGSLMALYACIQFLDVILDCLEGRWNIVPGILVLVIVFLIGAARLFPFWSLSPSPQA